MRGLLASGFGLRGSRVGVLFAVVAVGGAWGAGAIGEEEKKAWLHAPLDELLRQYVEDGVVDYAGLKKVESRLLPIA